MKPLLGVFLLLAASSSAAFAATKDSDPPDREMLKMMEFLRQMEMIKQMEMLRDMQHLEGDGAETKAPIPQTRAPGKKKEAVK
jgi:hypothetical protein